MRKTRSCGGSYFIPFPMCVGVKRKRKDTTKNTTTSSREDADMSLLLHVFSLFEFSPLFFSHSIKKSEPVAVQCEAEEYC
jgi:hypothetical protein